MKNIEFGKNEKYIYEQLEKGPLHFSLIDPDFEKVSPEKIEEMAKNMNDFGTDVILVGGSTNVDMESLDKAIDLIKKHFKKPVILFPGSSNGVSGRADGIFFMSLLNSKDPEWLVGHQKLGAPFVKKFGIETLPVAYLIVEPGMKAGEVGRADSIKQDDIDSAISYALTAQYFGMRFVYLEAGSGADRPVPAKMIEAVKKNTNVTLIVGGGIRTKEAAEAALQAGADIIVTGTIIEDDMNKVKPIIDTIKDFKK